MERNPRFQFSSLSLLCMTFETWQTSSCHQLTHALSLLSPRAMLPFRLLTYDGDNRPLCVGVGLLVRLCWCLYEVLEVSRFDRAAPLIYSVCYRWRWLCAFPRGNHLVVTRPWRQVRVCCCIVVDRDFPWPINTFREPPFVSGWQPLCLWVTDVPCWTPL